MKLLKTIIVSLILIIAIRSFIVTSYEIKGQSMTPSFHTGDRVLVNLVEDVFIPPKEGDVIFFKLNDRDTFVKRVAATPEDYIAVHDDWLYVNGHRTKYHSASLKELLHIEGMKSQIVPKKCYIVLGDHLSESADSRVYGCIEQSNVIGKVMTTFWHTTKK